MKKNLLTLLLMTLSLSGMAQDSDAELTTSYQHSAFALFNALTVQESANLCFSPLSVQIAMSMVQNGAAGNTLSQIQEAFGTTGFSNNAIGEFNSKLTQKLTKRPPFNPEEFADDPDTDPQNVFDGLFPKCELSNSLWTRPDVQPYSTFVDALRSYYDAHVESVEFDTWEGIGKINDWANEKTHGLIPKIYEEPQSDELALMLANALYFKGAWSIPFDPEETEEGPFLLNDETFATVDVMCARDVFSCTLTPSFRVITLNYGANGQFSMTVFVPLEGTALPPLTFEDWNASQKMTSLHVNLYMPRFSVDGNYNLITVLQRLGITDAFGTAADFTKLCRVNRAINSVRQMSRIIVNEEGTEAAAITAIEATDGIDLTRPEDYQDFKVDRPFYFTIQNRTANAILFIGRVTNLQGPVSQVTAIRRPTSDSSRDGVKKAGAVLDLSGRRAGALRSSIYIKDGRKVVVSK